jgi:hypothetical protein
MRSRGWPAGGSLWLALSACGGAATTRARSTASVRVEDGAAPADASAGAPSVPLRDDPPRDDQCDGNGSLDLDRSDDDDACSTCVKPGADAGVGLAGVTSFRAMRAGGAWPTYALLSEYRDYRSADYRATWQGGVLRIEPDPTTPPDILLGPP